MAKIYPFDGKSSQVEALFGSAFSYDPNNPTRYTEGLSYLLGTVVRELDLGAVGESSKIALSWENQESARDVMVDDLVAALSAVSELPSIISDMMADVYVPLLKLGCQFLVSDDSQYKWIGRSIIEEVLLLILGMARKSYEDVYKEEEEIESLPSEGVEERLRQLVEVAETLTQQESVVEIDDVRIWARSKLFDGSES